MNRLKNNSYIRIKGLQLVVYPRINSSSRGNSRRFQYVIGFLCLVGIVLVLSPFLDSHRSSTALQATVEAILICGLGLIIPLLQLIWGPLLSMNEQEILLRPNPFRKPINLRWEEIDAFIPFMNNNKSFFDVILVPSHREAFLQRQSPSNRKILIKKFEHSNVVARFSDRFLPPGTTFLLDAIQELYHVQIKKYHISLKPIKRYGQLRGYGQ